MTEPVPPAAGPPVAAGSTGSSDSPAPTAGQPAVLVARAPERAAGLLALLRGRGLDPVASPVIERAPVEDPAELDAARERLADGAYDWVAITSVNAVDALLGPESAESRSVHAGPVRWAAVGPATEQALAAHGISVDLVPRTTTGAGLADAFPVAPLGPAHRVLLPLGDLASDTLRAGLAAKGWVADVVTAYRTVARELPAELRGSYDVVVVTSGSAARQVAAQLGPQRVVAIGGPSAGTARAVGHTVLAVAATPTDAALADAVTEALVRT
ncbi:uroporphyrinogen-III synthase [Promicromonospora sp. MEB111]|uniref:uroporphyrinogen-III synthase n=1 Tax=Promicromonospora sp. MEB111 TaxID=3040301 RepID=UPI00254C95F7|nr:uroporphyrinogen-III synthase [Promicromonospora sp. MEB111]